MRGGQPAQCSAGTHTHRTKIHKGWSVAWVLPPFLKGEFTHNAFFAGMTFWPHAHHLKVNWSGGFLWKWRLWFKGRILLKKEEKHKMSQSKFPVWAVGWSHTSRMETCFVLMQLFLLWFILFIYFTLEATYFHVWNWMMRWIRKRRKKLDPHVDGNYPPTHPAIHPVGLMCMCISRSTYSASSGIEPTTFLNCGDSATRCTTVSPLVITTQLKHNFLVICPSIAFPVLVPLHKRFLRSRRRWIWTDLGSLPSRVVGR